MTKTKLINLTPHTVSIVLPDGSTMDVQPSGTVARCQTERVQVGVLVVDGYEIPVNRTRFGQVQGLPDPVPGTVYIVSAVAAQAAADRDDLVIPDDTVRDDQGRIVGCRAFARI